MNDETRELLIACKKAGYEFITIGVVDKRVPISQKIEKYGEQKYHTIGGGLVAPSGGDYWGETWREDEETGEKIITHQAKVVCAAPERRETGRPALWKICEESPLTAGMLLRGCGHGESHNVRANHHLDMGCYNLAELQVA